MITSGIVAAMTLYAYPFLEHLADLERGYNSTVFGGEELAWIFGAIVIPALILLWKHDSPSADDEEVV